MGDVELAFVGVHNLYRGDCLDVLELLPDSSIEALVTDPPAGIAFMGKKWDKDKGGLCRMITPPGGIVLDPFMGSGSTALACVREEFSFIGVEQEEASFETARARLLHALGRD